MHLSLSLSLGSTMGGVGRGYDPITALGDDLLAWWTADDAASLTLVGSAVSAWRDQKNGYEVTQGVSSARPVYSATSFGGSPGLTFDGIDDVLNLESSPLPSGSTAFWIWCVCQQDSLVADTNVRVAVSVGGAAATVRRIQRGVVSGANRAQVVVGDGVSGQQTNETTIDLSSRHLLRADVGPTATELSIDASADVTLPVVPGTSTTRVNIGANTGTQTGGNFWEGLNRDVAVTNPLTTEQAAAFETYLLARRAL